MNTETSSTLLRVVPFADEHGAAFKALNLAWISEHWDPEPEDFKSLDHPRTYILDPGGYIAIALEGDQVIGTCALIRKDDETYELAKMAVAHGAKGRGMGERLALAVIDHARSLGAKRVFLESNTILVPAMNLYRKLGFVEVSAAPSPYARANVQMELQLDQA